MSIFIPERVYQRVIAWADRDEETGCLVSRYSVGSHGYAQIGWREDGVAIMTLAHRVVWVHERGEIPKGMTVDHGGHCSNRHCVEIEHLRLLTNYENARRNGQYPAWPLGQCAHGHPNSELQLYGKVKPRLLCRPCRLESQRRWRESKRKT